jgi:hypothetical protein
VRRRSRWPLGAIALCAVLLGLVVAIAPWSGSNDFLARAAAALGPGSGGGVLYERWERTGPAGEGVRATNGPDQLWIEAGAPQRYRLVLQPSRAGEAAPANEAGLAAAYGVALGFVGRRGVLTRLRRTLAREPLEVGGQLQEREREEPTLTFVPPEELWSMRLSIEAQGTPPLPGPHEQLYPGADPVSALRAALVEGRAHDAGSSRLDGRAVERIDFDPQPLPADAPPLPPGVKLPHDSLHAYVEAGTLRPLEIANGESTYRILAYEHLPATRANLALTDVRAQHPDARVVHIRR